MTGPRFLLILTLLEYALGQGEVGDICSMEITGTRGTCRLSSDCPIAKRQANRGIKPTICGYDINSLPIVCCQGQVEAHENSFLNFPSNSDGIVYPEDNVNEIPLSERKCLEYSKPIRSEVQVIPLLADAVPTSYNITKCEYDGLALIIGGVKAQKGEFPFMAAIGFRDPNNDIKWNCGGTLVSENFVLTVAHCADTRLGAPVKVRLGALDLTRSDGEIDYDIDHIIKHPEYRGHLQYNDIALIKLKGQVQFTKWIRPACLWTDPVIRQPTATAIGWGLTERGGEQSDVLLKVGLSVMPKSQCDRTYKRTSKLPNGIVDSMVCAGDLKGGKDTCQGDSGGPLFVTTNRSQCIFYVVGLTSFGKYCAIKDTPAIYTRVSSYIPWIQKTIW